MTVVFDTSLVIKWLADEPDSQDAINLRVTWIRLGKQPMAPSLRLAETANALLQRVGDGTLSLFDADIALHELPRFLTFAQMTTGQSRRALSIAYRLGNRSVYDFFYIALAEELG